MKPTNHKQTAILAAKQAGKKINQHFYNRKRIKMDFKGLKEIVTKADLEAEKTIKSIIKKYYPKHQILSEESGLDKTKSDYLWIVDPLDGTTNFTMKHPLFCVCIALAHKGEVLAGVIYVPVLDYLFAAEKGKGAFLNGQRIHVSKQNNFSKSLLTYCHGSGMKHLKFAASFYEYLGLKKFKLRQFGAAGVEFAWVAAGWTEAYVVPGLNPWDVAAGALIVQEAGGRVTNFQNKTWSFADKEILASNGLIHRDLLRVLEKVK